MEKVGNEVKEMIEGASERVRKIETRAEGEVR